MDPRAVGFDFAKSVWALVREAPVLAVAILLFLILSGFGRSLGLPLLFWRTTSGGAGEKSGARFVVGLAVGVLLAACCFVGCLTEVTLWPGSAEAFGRAFGVCCLAVAAVLVVLSTPWVRRRAHQGVATAVRALSGGSQAVESIAPVGGTGGERKVWQLPAGGVLGIGFLWAVVAFSSAALPGSLASQRPVLLLLANIRAPRGHLFALANLHVVAALLLAAGVVAYFVLWAGNRLAGREIYPAAAVCLVFAVVVAVHSFLILRVPAGMGTVLLLVLLGYAVLDSKWQRTRVAGLAYPGARGSHPAGEGKPLLSDAKALESWRAQHGSSRPVLVVVTADGGGIRAALWTASVLTSLEQRKPSLPKHVRLMTGASGGMLGATYWAATLTDGGEHFDGGALAGDGILDRVQTGALSAVTSGLVFRDLWPPPLRVGRDRGTELERTWEKCCRRLADPIGSLRDGEEAGWRPSVVLSPMVVEDGRRLVISNLDLGALLSHEAATVASPADLSLSGCQALETWPEAAESLHLSTAVRLQANFPWVLPSTEVPPFRQGEPPCRVVDAGYYDETGVDLACAWLRQHFDALKDLTSGVVLLQIRDSSSIGRYVRPQDRRGVLSRGLDGLLTPVSALLRARDATTWYRNDASVAELSQRWAAVAGPKFFSTAIAQFGGEASLSWSLTGEEASGIRGYVDDPQVRNVLDGLAARLT